MADLAGDAGRRLGMSEVEVTTLRRAGLVHDLGRLGVSNAIWDKPDPLGAGEWERVRLHPYLTERMLQQSPSLAPLGAIAVQHARAARRLGLSARPLRRGDLAAGPGPRRRRRVPGDARAAPLPRRRCTADEAAAELRAEVRAGRLDGEAVEAVLGAAGHRVPRRREGPAGLTPREVEVLRLLARGLSNKEIAARLVISPKTVGNHVEHIYAKIGASNRAGASLFAMQHGLLPEERAVAACAERWGECLMTGARSLPTLGSVQRRRRDAEGFEERAPRTSSHTARSRTGTRTSRGTRSTSCRFGVDIDATPLLKGLPGDRCPCPHWGYVLKGRITYRFEDHDEVVEAGDAFYLPPGPRPVVEAGTEFVQFSPTEQLDKVSGHMTETAKRMQGAGAPG